MDCNGAYFLFRFDVAIEDFIMQLLKQWIFLNIQIRDQGIGKDDVVSILLTHLELSKTERLNLLNRKRFANEYFKKYGTLGEYTHLRLNEENK